MEKIKGMFKNLSMPHPYVLLFGLVLIMAVLSWIVPAGQFDKIMVGDREVIDPSSFKYVANNPQNLFDVLMSIPEGFARSQHISFFLFVTGGAFGLINKSGAIEKALEKLVYMLKGKENIVIPIVLLVVGLGGSTIGLSEETIVFIGLSVTLARAMGYDALVGVGMIALGAGLGFTSGFMNPFSVGVAQSIAELPTFSGMSLRLVLFVVVWMATAAFLMRYAHNIKKDFTKSLMYEEEMAIRNSQQQVVKTEEVEMTRRQKLILLVFFLSFVVIVYGVMVPKWYISEIGAVFLGMGLVCALIDGQKPGDIADTFIAGAGDMLYAALVVGLAQSVVVIMENGIILDTMIHGLTQSISSLPSYLSAIGIYFVQIIINFFLSSGSGQAAVTMPIMVPLADTLGVTRQTAVLAFQLGNGFLDSIMPMSGVLMAQLAIAKIPYKKWFKFSLPLMVIWLIIGLVFVVFAQVTGYGPF